MGQHFPRTTVPVLPSHGQKSMHLRPQQRSFASLDVSHNFCRKCQKRPNRYLIIHFNRRHLNLQGDLSFNLFTVFKRKRPKRFDTPINARYNESIHPFLFTKGAFKTKRMMRWRESDGIWITQESQKAEDTCLAGAAPHFFERIQFYVDCRWMERL